MTKQELNRDIKRLFKKVFSDKYKSNEEMRYKTELLRLYRADQSFEYINRDNILRMMRMNLRLRVITLHTFGIYINEEKLL